MGTTIRAKPIQLAAAQSALRGSRTVIHGGDRAMPNELDPRVEQWYVLRGKGQSFCVTAIDEQARTVEVQHFDGDIEEFTFDEWRALNVEPGEEPENWSGALDISERDDFGTEITDTSAHDWGEPQNEYYAEGTERRKFPREEPETGAEAEE
jgi:hypothetical protein